MSSKSIVDLLTESDNTIEGKLWQLSCDLDEISYKLETARSICGVVATSFDSDLNDESGAVWGVHDILQAQGNLLDEISSDALHIRKQLMESQEPKKGKKK
jgi:hypothetical protein